MEYLFSRHTPHIGVLIMQDGHEAIMWFDAGSGEVDWRIGPGALACAVLYLTAVIMIFLHTPRIYFCKH
jgi:hypothetical protein